MPDWYSSKETASTHYNIIGVYARDQCAAIGVPGVQPRNPNLVLIDKVPEPTAFDEYVSSVTSRLASSEAMQPLSYFYLRTDDDELADMESDDTPVEEWMNKTQWTNTTPVECSDGTRLAFMANEDVHKIICRTCNKTSHAAEMCVLNGQLVSPPYDGNMIAPGFSIDTNEFNKWVWIDDVFEQQLEQGQPWIRPMYIKEDIPRSQYTNEDGSYLDGVYEHIAYTYTNAPYYYNMPLMEPNIPKSAQEASEQPLTPYFDDEYAQQQ